HKGTPQPVLAMPWRLCPPQGPASGEAFAPAASRSCTHGWGGFSVSGTPNVSQHPVRGLRAGQDGSSEPSDEGAGLALNLAAESPALDGDRILVDELTVEGVAGHAGVVGGHARAL